MKSFIITIFSLLLFFRMAYGQIPDRPSNYITDIANYIDDTQEIALNDTLRAFERLTTHQIFVLISDTMGGQDIDALGPELAEKWSVGQAGKDNGVLITLFVKDRQLRIDVGYGLEADLTDYQTALVRENTMNPLLRQEKYGDAVKAGVYEIMNILGEVDAAPAPIIRRTRPSGEKVGFEPIIWWFDETVYVHFVLLIILLVLELISSFFLWGKIVKKYRHKISEAQSRRLMLWGSHAVLFVGLTIVYWLNAELYYSVYIVPINNVSHWFFMYVIGFWGMIPLAMWLHKWKKAYEVEAIKDEQEVKNEAIEIEAWGGFELIRSFLAHIFFSLIIWVNYGLIMAWVVGEVDFDPAAIVGTIVASFSFTLTFYLFYSFFLSGGSFGSGGRSFSSGGSSSFGSGTFSGGGSSSWGGGGFSGGGGGSFGGGGSSGSW